MTMIDAVRGALKELGEVSNEELAAHVQQAYGVVVRLTLPRSSRNRRISADDAGRASPLRRSNHPNETFLLTMRTVQTS